MMWFKNMQVYRLPKPWAMTASELQDQLSRGLFAKCGAKEPMSRS